MEKQTRKEKKAEEARILAEMKAALEEAERAEVGESEVESESAPKWEPPAPQAPAHYCRRCKTALKNGVCPICGFKMYVPMDEKKLGKIRLVTTAVCMVLFVALFIYIQIKKN